MLMQEQIIFRPFILYPVYCIYVNIFTQTLNLYAICGGLVRLNPTKSSDIA
jgi:hypothetical protein